MSCFNDEISPILSFCKGPYAAPSFALIPLSNFFILVIYAHAHKRPKFSLVEEFMCPLLKTIL